MTIEYLGWAATTVFVASYFCTRSSVLKAVQMTGALLWVVYGLCIGASPVVVANLAPRKMRGIESNGMILMAEDGGRLFFVNPDDKIAPGSGVS